MTEQEFKDFYDLACIEAGLVNAPHTRITFNMILQLIAHLKGQTNNLNARITVTEEHPRG